MRVKFGYFEAFWRVSHFPVSSHRSASSQLILLVKIFCSSSFFRNSSCMELFHCQSWIPLHCRVLQISFDSCLPQALLKLRNFHLFSFDIRVCFVLHQSSEFTFDLHKLCKPLLKQAHLLRVERVQPSSSWDFVPSSFLCSTFSICPHSTLHVSLSSMCNPWLCHCWMDTKLNLMCLTCPVDMIRCPKPVCSL